MSIKHILCYSRYILLYLCVLMLRGHLAQWPQCYYPSLSLWPQIKLIKRPLPPPLRWPWPRGFSRFKKPHRRRPQRDRTNNASLLEYSSSVVVERNPSASTLVIALRGERLSSDLSLSPAPAAQEKGGEERFYSLVGWWRFGEKEIFPTALILVDALPPSWCFALPEEEKKDSTSFFHL